MSEFLELQYIYLIIFGLSLQLTLHVFMFYLIGLHHPEFKVDLVYNKRIKDDMLLGPDYSSKSHGCACEYIWFELIVDSLQWHHESEDI